MASCPATGLGGDLGFGAVASAAIAANSQSVLLNNIKCGIIPVFPTLPEGFPVKWRPTFKTTVGAASSGRETRWINQSYGLHEFEIPFEVLRDETQNQSLYSPLGCFKDFMLLLELWLSMYGQGGQFYFSAPWDGSRQDQTIGTGDGTTTSFVVWRQFGRGVGSALNESIGGLQAITNVKLNGTVTPISNYYGNGNFIIFNTAPAAGVVVTATFNFYYLCHFVDDKQDFEEFFKNIWAVRSLKFRSVTASGAGFQGPPAVV